MHSIECTVKKQFENYLKRSRITKSLSTDFLNVNGYKISQIFNQENQDIEGREINYEHINTANN